MPSSARRLMAAFSILVLAAVAAPLAQADPPAPAGGQVWQQTFADDFSGVALDPTKWTGCYWWQSALGCTNSGNGELQWYQPQNVVVGNGIARLIAKQETVLGSDG